MAVLPGTGMWSRATLHRALRFNGNKDPRSIGVSEHRNY